MSRDMKQLFICREWCHGVQRRGLVGWSESQLPARCPSRLLLCVPGPSGAVQGSALPVFQAPVADRAWEELDHCWALKKGGTGGRWEGLSATLPGVGPASKVSGLCRLQCPDA